MRTWLPSCLLALALLAACGPSPRQRTATVLDDVESYINERPDSALAVLRALDSTAVRGRALRARAALLHSMALDKCYIDLQTDSILAPAVSYYARHGSPDEKLRTQYYLGRLQYNAGEYQKAIVTYTEALALTDRATDYKYIGFVNQAIADTYGVTNLEQEALPFLNTAYNCFDKGGYKEMALRTQYKIACLYGTEKRVHLADSLFRDLLNKDLSGFLRMHVLSDYGFFLTANNLDTKRSIQLFEQAVRDFGTLLNVNHWAAYAYALSVENRKKESESLFRQIEDLFGQDPFLLYWQGRNAENRGDYRTAFTDLSRSLQYQDSVVRASLSQSAIHSQKEYYQSCSEVAAAQIRAQRLRFGLMISFLVILISSVLFILILKDKNYKNQSERFMQMMESLEKRVTEITGNHEQLFHSYLHVYSQLSEEYERTKDSGRLDHISFRKLRSNIARLRGEGKGTFEEIINHQMDNIIADFRADYGNILKEDDISLFSFLVSGFDTITASTLLGITQEAYYMRKSRIKRILREHEDSTKAEKYLYYFEKRRR